MGSAALPPAVSLQWRIGLLIGADHDAFCQNVALYGLKHLITRRPRTNIERPVQRQHLEMIVVRRIPHRRPGTVVSNRTTAGRPLQDALRVGQPGLDLDALG